MKKIKVNALSLFLVFGFILSSCSSDDDATSNSAPRDFNLIQIPDGSLDVKLKPTFTWSASQSPDASPITYDLYLDTNNPPTTIEGSNLNNTIYDLENNLQFGTIYYWKVVAKTSNGEKTESKVSSFKTREETNKERLIGKWYLNSIEVPGNPDEPLIDECSQKSIYEFSDTGVLSATVYALNSDDECELSYNSMLLYEFVSESKINIIDSKTKEMIPYDVEIIGNTMKLRGEGTVIVFIKAED